MERRDFITVAVAAAAIGAASQAQAQGAGGASMHPAKIQGTRGIQWPLRRDRQ